MQQVGIVVGASRPKGVVMSPLNDCDCIYLDVAQVLNRLRYSLLAPWEFRTTVKYLAMKSDPAGLRQ